MSEPQIHVSTFRFECTVVSKYFCYLVLNFPCAHDLQWASKSASSPDITYPESAACFHSSAYVIQYKLNYMVSFKGSKAG